MRLCPIGQTVMKKLPTLCIKGFEQLCKSEKQKGLSKYCQQMLPFVGLLISAQRQHAQQGHTQHQPGETKLQLKKQTSTSFPKYQKTLMHLSLSLKHCCKHNPNGCQQKVHLLVQNYLEEIINKINQLLPNGHSINCNKAKLLMKLLSHLKIPKSKNKNVPEYDEYIQIEVRQKMQNKDIRMLINQEVSVLNKLGKEQQKSTKTFQIEKIMSSNLFQSFEGDQGYRKEFQRQCSKVKHFFSNYIYFPPPSKAKQMIVIDSQRELKKIIQDEMLIRQCLCRALNCRYGQIYIGLQRVKGKKFAQYKAKGFNNKVMRQFEPLQDLLNKLMTQFQPDQSLNKSYAIDYLPIYNTQSQKRLSEKDNRCLRITVDIERRRDKKLYTLVRKEKDYYKQQFYTMSSSQSVLFEVTKQIDKIWKQDQLVQKI